MKNNPYINFLCVVAVLACVLACRSTEAADNPFLENLLSASDDRAFNKALSIYGTLKSEDVAIVVRSTASKEEQRRRNAAMMLNLCRQDECPAAQAGVVHQTEDVAVWAILIERAARDNENLLGERPELLTNALASDDPELLAPALRVALKVGHEGIQEKCRLLLGSKDRKVLEVVLDNLSPAVAKQEADRLLVMLTDNAYDNVSMKIAMAIVRTGDQRYHPQIKTYLDGLKADKSDYMFFNGAVFSEDKQMVDFLWLVARTKSGSLLADLRDQAYDALTRRVTAPSMREPVSYELVEMSLVYLKAASQGTSPRDHFNESNYGAKSAGYLVAFLNKGNTEFESFLWGKDAVAFTETWLRKNKK